MEPTHRSPPLIIALSTIWVLAALPTSTAAETKPDGGEQRARPTMSLEALLKSFDDEPPVRDVRRVALRHAGLEKAGDARWEARARWSNLLPEVGGDVAWLDQRDETFRYTEDIEAQESGRLRRDSARNRFYEDTRLRRAYGVDAEIDLGGLIFDRDELSASRERRKREFARRKLVALVTDLYFDRRKKQILRLAAPPTGWRKRLDLIMEIDRMTARLDGLTGGWFRKQLEEDDDE